MMKLVATILTAVTLAAAGASAAEPLKPEQQYGVSFSYNGEAFSPETWSCRTLSPDRNTMEKVYTSPDGKLRLNLSYIDYPDFPVTEVRPVLECVGDAPTGIIDGFRSLVFSREFGKEGVLVRRITGSNSEYSDFAQSNVRLTPRHECDRLHISTSEGRSSAWLPYFGFDFSGYDGLEIALGWTGTWSVDVECAKRFSLSAGIGGTTHFRMLPGEKFQMPYAVIYRREGKSVDEGLAEFHRFVMAHKSPRDTEGNVLGPILPLTASGGNKTDDNMLKVMETATSAFKNIPFDTFWVDAGWYGIPEEVDQSTNCGPYWYLYPGLWHPNTFIHPDGNLRKVADAARAKGMRFLLWFEPERVTERAPIMKEHPEYLLSRKENQSGTSYLLNLGNPDAWNWIVEEVSRNIRETGVDIYRQDFNMNPLPAWRDNDAPDRQGVNEIRHINGLYAFWDELQRRFPDLRFENCASGGTRTDIEMMSRAHSYCRDDAQMSSGCDNLCQNITLNSTPYVPFTGGETFTVPVFDTYAWLSRLGGTAVFTPTDFDGMFLTRDPSAEELAWFNSMLVITDRVRKYYMGDFYRLTGDSPYGFCGYQLNRAADGDGFVLIFRREECPDSDFFLNLRGIDPGATYTVEEFGGKTKKMKGSALAKQILAFDEPRTYKMIFYEKQ